MTGPKHALSMAFLLAAFTLQAQAKPQPPLPTITLEIGSVTITAEVADENHEREKGLMFRESLGPDQGMLFVMPFVGPASFYMRNTKIPLSIAYISPTGTILEIHDLEPLEETPVRSRFQNIAFALEMQRGWFRNHGIFPGASLKGLPSPPASFPTLP